MSTWANSPFKLTTPNSLTFSATFSYIGLDSSNPANRDIKLKILLGKRSYGNLDVLSTSSEQVKNEHKHEQGGEAGETNAVDDENDIAKAVDLNVHV